MKQSLRIVVDSNNLAWKAFHKFGGLSFRGSDTGVIFGFLKQVLSLAGKFRPHQFIFCFDSRQSYRRKVLPIYKENRRKNITDEQGEALSVAWKQIRILQRKVLPEMGFRNVLLSVGYEADDLIAIICQKYSWPKLIITSDEDIYQCLSPDNHIWNGKEILTPEWFKENIMPYDPQQWCHIKALAGCSSDNVPGIRGVGEKTAIKYWSGDLKSTAKIYKVITSDLGQAIYGRNLPLVTLPMMNNIKVNIKKDRISKVRLRKVFRAYGFKSFLQQDSFALWCKRFNIK